MRNTQNSTSKRDPIIILPSSKEMRIIITHDLFIAEIRKAHFFFTMNIELLGRYPLYQFINHLPASLALYDRTDLFQSD